MPDRFGGDGAAFAKAAHASLRVVYLVGDVAQKATDVARALRDLHLDELEFVGTDLGPAEMEVPAPALGFVKNLRISESRIEDRGLAALANSSLNTLEKLLLYRCGIGAAGVEAFAASPGFEKLKHLVIAGDHPAWPRSSRTDALPHNRIGSDGASALAKWQRSIDHIVLSGNAVGDEGARALAAWPSKPAALTLKTNNIGSAGAKAFAENDPGRMHTLDLQHNFIGKEGSRALADSPFIGKFRLLGLTTNEIDSDRAVDYTDWNGAVVSSGFEEMTPIEIRQAFGFPSTVAIQ